MKLLIFIISLFLLVTYTYSEDEIYVIETEVDGPDECIGEELYDAKEGVCYIEAKLDNAVAALQSEYNDLSISKLDSSATPNDTLLKDAEAIYTIDTNETFLLLSGVENNEHKKVKKWLKIISPNDFSNNYLSRLILMPSNSDNSAAYVGMSDYGKSGSWDVIVNMTSLREDGEKEMVFTLIHEYAHILTLNYTQVNENISPENCTTYDTISEGCTEENSYLNQFVQKFWKELLRKKPNAENYYDYYDSHSSEFVRDYAATNAVEDIAESFAYFVFAKKGTYTTIAEQKINFFYNYPELVEMRKNIRNSLKELVKAEILTNPQEQN